MKNLIWIWVSRKLTLAWYSDSLLSLFLLPFSYLFRLIVWVRKVGYSLGIFKVYRAPLPVIVVGNISVGGTGKTPLIIWLASLLEKKGWRPGIVCSGYGGYSRKCPVRISSRTKVEAVGDEALFLFDKVGCPVVAGSHRSECVRALVNQNLADVVLSDDGLQHYALGRDIEIAVIDGFRRLGNKRLLPAGPLREAEGRLQGVDFIVVKGCSFDNEIEMLIEPTEVINIRNPLNRLTLESFKGMTVNAVAGVGNNESFFTLLGKEGLEYKPRAFPDHYRYSPDDLDFSDGLPIIMTEKDAIKCKDFAGKDWWSLSIRVALPYEFEEQFLNKLSR